MRLIMLGILNERLGIKLLNTYQWLVKENKEPEKTMAEGKISRKDQGRYNVDIIRGLEM